MASATFFSTLNSVASLRFLHQAPPFCKAITGFILVENGYPGFLIDSKISKKTFTFPTKR